VCFGNGPHTSILRDYQIHIAQLLTFSLKKNIMEGLPKRKCVTPYTKKMNYRNWPEDYRPPFMFGIIIDSGVVQKRDSDTNPI
jgi:hypothetical protein